MSYAVLPSGVFATGISSGAGAAGAGAAGGAGAGAMAALANPITALILAAAAGTAYGTSKKFRKFVNKGAKAAGKKALNTGKQLLTPAMQWPSLSPLSGSTGGPLIKGGISKGDLPPTEQLATNLLKNLGNKKSSNGLSQSFPINPLQLEAPNSIDVAYNPPILPNPYQGIDSGFEPYYRRAYGGGY